ncbi:hypothetical protein N9L48_04205 [Psychrosphaera sp.]|nr:hypothetical protein [Psychrosphaera sp.]
MTGLKPLQFAITILLLVGIGLTVNADDLPCLNETNENNTCEQAEVKKVTWWGWLTDNKTTQFHFFDLIELMYADEPPKYPEFSDNTPGKSIR